MFSRCVHEPVTDDTPRPPPDQGRNHYGAQRATTYRTIGIPARSRSVPRRKP